MRRSLITALALGLGGAGCAASISSGEGQQDDAGGVSSDAAARMTDDQADAGSNPGDGGRTRGDGGPSPRDDAGMPPPRQPGVFVAVGDRFARIGSSDGDTWEDPVVLGDVSGDADVIRDVAYGNGMFVCVNNSSRVFRSTDGQRWEEVRGRLEPDGSPGWFGGLIFAEGYFWGAGNDRIARSTDGVVWERVLRSSGAKFRTIGYGGGTWIAGGDDGLLAVSADGREWEVSTDGGPGYQGIAYGLGTFVLVGHGGRVSVWLDGRVDLEVPEIDAVTSDTLRDITFDLHAERFHIVGDEAVAVFDGATWLVREGPGSLFGVTYGTDRGGEGIVVSVARSGEIYRSPDGLEWTRVFSSDIPFRDIHFAVLSS